MTKENTFEMTEEEKWRLCQFFQLLIEIDQQKLITQSAKERHAKKYHPAEKGDVIDLSCICQKRSIDR